MEKTTLSIIEIISAKNAIDHLLNLPGIPFQKTYWFDRLRKNLVAPINRWVEIQSKTYQKYAVEIPAHPFIPYDKYAEFRKEFDDYDGEEYEWFVERLLTKYEVTSKQKGKALPVESKEQYEAEIAELAKRFEREIEYNKIEVDPSLMKVFQQLPGELQLALSFAIIVENPSGIVVVPAGKISLQ